MEGIAGWGVLVLLGVSGVLGYCSLKKGGMWAIVHGMLSIPLGVLLIAYGLDKRIVHWTATRLGMGTPVMRIGSDWGYVFFGAFLLGGGIWSIHDSSLGSARRLGNPADRLVRRRQGNGGDPGGGSENE